MRIRQALIPLHIVSKLFCTSPFSLSALRPSKLGSALIICQSIVYTIFHLWMVNRDMSAESTKNLVRQLIDSYNRYSGFCVFSVLVITSILSQAKIVSAIKTIEEIDLIFEQQLNTNVNNRSWRRNVCLQMFFCIFAITILEWRNCLMYIQDSVPFSEYCLVMCLVPMYVIGVIEIQFFAYLQLVRNRLCLINEVLFRFYEGVSVQRKTCKNKLTSLHAYITNEDDKETNMKSNYVNGKVYPCKTSDEKMMFRASDLATKITQIQIIYTKIERTTIILKSAFGPHLVVILIIKFTTLTSLLYFSCMVIIKIISGTKLSVENQDQLLSSWAWICAFILEIFTLCYACAIMKVEYNKIGYNLHHFISNLDDIDCKLKAKSLSLQLLFNRIEVNPLGLFQLDLGFMYALIGAVCTYLIILIQFDLAQKV